MRHSAKKGPQELGASFALGMTGVSEPSMT